MKHGTSAHQSVVINKWTWPQWSATSKRYTEYDPRKLCPALIDICLHRVYTRFRLNFAKLENYPNNKMHIYNICESDICALKSSPVMAFMHCPQILLIWSIWGNWSTAGNIHMHWKWSFINKTKTSSVRFLVSITSPQLPNQIPEPICCSSFTDCWVICLSSHLLHFYSEEYWYRMYSPSFLRPSNKVKLGVIEFGTELQNRAQGR